MNRYSRGFTLIEVMIAILVFGLTAGAVSVASAQAITSARQIEEQTEARWIAQNYLTQIRLEHRLPDAGKTNEKVDFNNKKWVVELEVSVVEMELFGPFLRHVKIKTKIDGEEQFADVLIAVLGEAPSQ